MASDFPEIEMFAGSVRMSKSNIGAQFLKIISETSPKSTESNRCMPNMKAHFSRHNNKTFSQHEAAPPTCNCPPLYILIVVIACQDRPFDIIFFY